MTLTIPRITILHTLTSMISILTNPLSLKMLYSKETRRIYPVAIIKCDVGKEKKKTNERKRKKKDLVMIFSDGKDIVMNVLFERRTASS